MSLIPHVLKNVCKHRPFPDKKIILGLGRSASKDQFLVQGDIRVENPQKSD